MSVRVVRLGTARQPDEGLRIGTVRRPPRGVLKSRYLSDDWFDVWFPNLAPSLQTMKQGHAATTEAQLRAYKKKYRAEMSLPEAARSISLLAALSHSADFSVGCYCEDEHRCHRTVLRELLADAGAKLA
jgi:uncharacterized protein YeaO (DUF488 family)